MPPLEDLAPPLHIALQHLQHHLRQGSTAMQRYGTELTFLAVAMTYSPTHPNLK